MDIDPPHMHMHLDELFSAGLLPMSTVGAPGNQGATVFGMQGMGVNTPNAAAVAAATVGLATLVQAPKGIIFTNGM